jgi:hypothetical protein
MTLLAYNEVCFKASHNSYGHPLTHPPGSLVPWNPEPLFDLGVRGLELDIWEWPSGEWTVSHNGEVPDTPDHHLTGYLERIREWSEQDQTKDPLQIVLDIKSARGPSSTFADRLDRYIWRVMQGARLVTPGDLLRPGDRDLVDAARRGWGHIPMRGAFLFCVSGPPGPRTAYAASDPSRRRCFADLDLPVDKTMTQVGLRKGNRIIINVPADQWKWGANWLCHNPGFLLRVYDLGRAQWEEVVGTGANILATDDVEHLRVGPERFAPTNPVPPF